MSPLDNCSPGDIAVICNAAADLKQTASQLERIVERDQPNKLAVCRILEVHIIEIQKKIEKLKDRRPLRP
jgi:hypothetical protein